MLARGAASKYIARNLCNFLARKSANGRHPRAGAGMHGRQDVVWVKYCALPHPLPPRGSVAPQALHDLLDPELVPLVVPTYSPMGHRIQALL